MEAKKISLTMLGVGVPSARQNIQMNDRAFNDMMSNISQKKDNQDLISKQSNHLSSKQQNRQLMNNKLSLNHTSDQQAVKSTTDKIDQKAELAPMSDENLQKVVEELETLVEDTFGLSQDDENALIDMMEQMMNLLFPLNSEINFTEKNLAENQSFEETSGNGLGLSLNDLLGLDKEQLKDLVLGFHGIEDASAFLTNTDLMQELDSLTEGIEDILSQLDDMLLSEENQSKIISVSEQAVEIGNDGTNENVESGKSMLDMQNNVDVLVETETSSQNGTNLNQSNDNETLHNTESKTTVTDKKSHIKETTQNPVDTFVAKINEAFGNSLEKSGQTTHAPVDIVNQVVNHIRVRVLPETTSMELSLNPQHLGKVDIAISSSNGVAKATMTVQSEAAKEALESQLITLKETFAEKGIKVVSVEVNVSEFGFKNESDGKGEQNKTKQNGSKKIRLGKLEDDDEIVVEEEASRTENSTIDYIA